MAAWRSMMEWKTPRLKRRLVSLAKKPSTALSQEAEVGVKWKVKRWCRSARRGPWDACGRHSCRGSRGSSCRPCMYGAVSATLRRLGVRHAPFSVSVGVR